MRFPTLRFIPPASFTASHFGPVEFASTRRVIDESAEAPTPWSERIEVTLTDVPMPTDVDRISDDLDRFNIDVTGIEDRKPMAVLVKNQETGEVLGGMTGRTSLGLMFVDLFHLPEHLRGNGLGSRILRMAEAEGRRRGCRAAVLYTISFQAPAFYQRHGWEIFGEVPCEPQGTRRIFMTKRIDGHEKDPGPMLGKA